MHHSLPHYALLALTACLACNSTLAREPANPWYPEVGFKFEYHSLGFISLTSNPQGLRITSSRLHIVTFCEFCKHGPSRKGRLHCTVHMQHGNTFVCPCSVIFAPVRCWSPCRTCALTTRIMPTVILPSLSL